MTLFNHTKAVLFDLDGTLLDSYLDLAAATNMVLQEQGRAPLPPEHYRCAAGAGARGLLKVAFGIEPDHAQFESLKEAFFTAYENNIATWTQAFDGIPPLLEKLKNHGIMWGVVTNKSSRFSEPLAKAFSFFEESGVLISGDTTPYSKPHPEPIFEAMRRMGVQPSECIYVGDDARDIQAGHAAGVRTVAASYGYIHGSIASWNADAVISHPLDLLKLIVVP